MKDTVINDFLPRIERHLIMNTSFIADLGLFHGSGIDWGIEYLLQNGLMESNSDEVLSEIDRKIMGQVIRRMKVFVPGCSSFPVIIRKGVVNSPCQNQDEQPFDEMYLADWVAAVKSIEIPDDKQILCSLLRTRQE
jgi:hypothetical protein